jgi:hypothetical protein
MENNATPLKLFIVQSESGTIINPTARTNYDACIMAFVKDRFPEKVWPHISKYRAGVVWDMFEESGWRVIEIDVPITTETT